MDKRELTALLESRRTYRKFDESKKIGDEVVKNMKYAAQLSSSAMNRQPLKYIYVRDSETVNSIFDITSWGGALPNGQGRPKTGERPTMFVAILSVKELQTRFTEFDAGLAASNLTLSAWSHGVGSCILGSVNVPKLCEILNVTDDCEVVTVIGFGYPTHDSRVVDAEVGDSLKYSLDEDGNYVVPKRKIDDTTLDV